MTHLTNLRIYELPHGKRSLVAMSIGDGAYFLYDSEYGTGLPPRFKVDADGRLINWFGDFPIFSVDDLIDTGKNYTQ
jgi:hypothetical protein